MFAQVFMAIIGLLLFYIGVVEGSIFNIIVTCILLTISAGRFYAANQVHPSKRNLINGVLSTIKKQTISSIQRC